MIPAKSRRRVGDLYAVPISNGYFAFGQICCGNDLAIFNYRGRSVPDVEFLRQTAVAFRVPFGTGEQKTGGWYFIGNSPPSGHLAEYSRYRHRPVLSEEVYAHFKGESTLSSAMETNDLEDLAFWLAFHIVSRIEDFFDGRENIHVSSIKNRNY